MTDLDRAHKSINLALLSSAINVLNEVKGVEAHPGYSEDIKNRKRLEAANALSTVIEYLNGDLVIMDRLSAQEAQARAESPAAVPQPPVKADAVSKPKVASKARVAKPKSKKKAAPKPKGKKTTKKTGELTCPKCGRDFKRAAGLGRHKVSCKG